MLSWKGTEFDLSCVVVMSDDDSSFVEDSSSTEYGSGYSFNLSTWSWVVGFVLA